jgi:hypothetical protein
MRIKENIVIEQSTELMFFFLIGQSWRSTNICRAGQIMYWYYLVMHIFNVCVISDVDSIRLIGECQGVCNRA